MSDLETKRSTENALKAFATQPLKAAATGLFIALAGPAPATSPAATSIFDATIFSFFFEDIVGLPLDSNSTKVGVSPYIGTNGG